MEQCYMKQNRGIWIVEKQQHGKSIAKYGQQVIKRFSEALTEQYGR